jgi:response regulator NasT
MVKTHRAATQHRVLIIDDSANSRHSLSQALKELGCAIIGEVPDARGGVEMVRNIRPDVVFIAIGLPDMDGITAARLIIEEVPTPIVILSSHHDEEPIRRATDAGIMTYLIKPLRKAELLPAIELTIRRFREFEMLRRENVDLKRALEERKLIERAKGILMKQEGLTEHEAFTSIRRASMKSRKPMVQIARALITAEEVSKGKTNERGRNRVVPRM